MHKELKTKRVENTHPHFVELIGRLDQELLERYGLDQAKYDSHNRLEPLPTALVGYLQGEPVACGCFKPFDSSAIEIKRMFVAREHRRKGYSSLILAELEKWGQELGYAWSVLETGKGQSEAIGLYLKHEYAVIPNYGPYENLPNSVCLKKGCELSKKKLGCGNPFCRTS